MKVNIMSDLHLEFGGFFEPPESDVLILAGDIGLANKPYTFVNFLEMASEKTKDIIMVMGNHEHYHGDIQKSKIRIQKATQHIDNFHLLENNAYLIGDVAFIGGTLWSDLSETVSNVMAKAMMNDYKIIKSGMRKLTPNDTTALHRLGREVIFNAVDVYRTQGYKTFVITHMSPTMFTAEQYRNSKLKYAYGTDLEDLIRVHQPDYWVYGHTHVSARYMVEGVDTDIICNPRGYFGEVEGNNDEFDPNLILEV